MKLKELKRIARRIKEPSFSISKDGEVVIRGTFIGWYTGKDRGLIKQVDFEDTDNWVSQIKTANDIVKRNDAVYLATDDGILRISNHTKVDDEYPKERVYDKTPMSKDFEKNCFNIDGSNSVFHEEHREETDSDMWGRILLEDAKEDTDECAKDMYSYAKDFGPLEYLFTGAPIMIEGCTEWFPYDKKYDHDNLRLPTIEESPLNMKLAWHPELRKPEGIDDYEYIIWHMYNDYPEECLIDWSRVTAFMLLKKK